jgi:hypothetical protein
MSAWGLNFFFSIEKSIEKKKWLKFLSFVAA